MKKYNDYITEERMKHRTFFSYALVAATAGSLGHVELWNPATSGLNMFVYKVFMSAASATKLTIRTHTSKIGSVAASHSNFVLGETHTHYAEPYIFTNAVAQGTELGAMFIGAGMAHSHDTNGLIVVPGRSLIIASGTVNADFYAGFEWAEIII